MNNRLLHAFAWLRTAALRRGMALAFLLSMAAAYASPVIAPRSIELLCSTHGMMKLLVQTADGEEDNSPTSHCGLCTVMAEPPSADYSALPTCKIARATSFLNYSAPLARVRPPLPARGPPALA